MGFGKSGVGHIVDVPHFSFVGVDVEILQRQAEGVTVCFQILRLDADEIALAGRDEQRTTEPIIISTGRKRCHPFLILETGTYEPGQSRVREHSGICAGDEIVNGAIQQNA